MYKILAIGNSFSEDATYYLHQILEHSGIENQVVNLYIGGCSLERHWQNIENDRRDYLFEINGQKTDRYVTVSEVIKETKWDVVVTQQASHDSGWSDTYEPFLGLMVDYLHEKAGDALIYLHETWAYAKDSDHDHFMRYHRNQKEMYDRLKANYSQMALKYRLPLIPSGDLIQNLRETTYFSEENGDLAICRDGYHMNYLYGRFALACMWARTICKVDLKKNGYVPVTDYMPFEMAKPEILDRIKEIVMELDAEE